MDIENYRCNIPMLEQPLRDLSDKYSWWCPQCKSMKSNEEYSGQEFLWKVENNPSKVAANDVLVGSSVSSE